MKPKFSIITCTNNSAEFLQENINSVKFQSLQDYEHVFVDAFSSDKTLEIINNYKNENPKKVKIFNQRPTGISDAMNLGAENASGKYLCHLHSDDLFYDQNVLQTVSNMFDMKPKRKWLIGDMVFVNYKGDGAGNLVLPEYSYSLLKRQNVIAHPSVFIRKDFFLQNKGFKKYKYAMDYEFWLRIGRNNPAQIHKFLSKFRVHEGSLSSKERINALKEEMYHRRKIKKDILTSLRDEANYIINYLKLK